MRSDPSKPDRRAFLALSVLTAAACLASPAFAQGMTREDRQRLRQLRRRAIRRFRRRGGGLPQRARAAIDRGEIQPLRRLFREVTRQLGVEIIDADLHETPRGWVYALRVLSSQDRIQDLYFDARTLAMIQQVDSAAEDGVPLPEGPLPIPNDR